MRKAAFREGFIGRMAERGVSPEDMQCMLADEGTYKIVRSALHATTNEKFASVVGEALEAIKGLSKGTLAAGLAIPPLLGGLYGYTFEPRTSPEDIESLKQMEVLREYQAAIDELERKRKSERASL